MEGIKENFKKAAYSLLGMATLGKGIPRVINGIRVRFPPRWSRYFGNDYEKENYSFLKQSLKPGMDVIDIGAHIGLFSAVSSQLTKREGKIVCIEPTPGTYAILKETLKLNGCDNVIALQAAVSDKEGTAVFYAGDAAACNSNSLVKNKSDEQLSAYDVKLVTIDSIVAAYSLKPSIIKIDAEGAELDVLKGGAETFKNYKPVLILGLHPAFIKQKGDSLEAIWDLLKVHSFSVKLEGNILTKEFFCRQNLLFDVHCFKN